MKMFKMFVMFLLTACVVACGKGGGGEPSSFNTTSGPPNTTSTFNISGTVDGASGATITMTGGSTGVATTDGSGNYSFSGLVNGSYTITPSLAGYTFSPMDTAVSVNNADVSGVSFTATPVVVPTLGGKLDTSFDSDGIVIFGVSAFPGTDEIMDIAVQSDGKIVAVGRGGNDSAIVRFNSDGSVDTAFASSGILIIPNYSYFSVVIQQDGKIVVGGALDAPNNSFAIARYNVSGAIDTAFGVGGIAVMDIAVEDFVNSLAIQPDGKIVAAGQSGNNSVAIRLTSAGLFDTTFGGSGVVITTTTAKSAATDIVVQADGKIVVSGYTSNSGKYGWLVIRYNTDGTLDTTFADNGKATTVIGTNYSSSYDTDFAYAIAVQSDGKIVVGGGTGGTCVPPNCWGIYQFALARYSADGTLDTMFGSGGIQLGTSSVQQPHIKAIAIQPDGKIVATGLFGEFLVARYNTDGSPDNSFVDYNKSLLESTPMGIGEVTISPLHDIFRESKSRSIAIQPDGRILIAGYSCGGWNGANPEFAIIRLLP